MPGARSSNRPLPAINTCGSSSLDERLQLEIRLQHQLEKDIARIFNESICSDLEVVCGKLKILTHSCILKARTHKFYHKLEAILHVNIGPNIFDAIYSFISDVYTECNIQKLENEIINYLNEDISNIVKTVVVTPKSKPEDLNEPEVYLTPDCTSPEEKNFRKAISSSPSTELTKEFYALVPIDKELDKELIEQDALSNAFQSIIKTQTKHVNDKQDKQCIKPTSLLLNSSNQRKINKYLNDDKNSEQNKCVDISIKKSNVPDTSTDKGLDSTYSPDSLITDDHSSSSDYLSAGYSISPSVVSSSRISQSNVEETSNKMENVITISDSGMENTTMLESLNSHRDVTVTDESFTESTCHDTINDSGTSGCGSKSSYEDKKHNIQKINVNTFTNILQSPTSGTSSGDDFKELISNKAPVTDISATSSKEEKQRQNEEIVNLESSSLSSETGSWESVFPPKLPDKDISQKFINSERQCAIETEIKSKPSETSRELLCPSLVQKSPFKSTSCFIDAASLADEGDHTITVLNETDTGKVIVMPSGEATIPDAPVTYATKTDLSPNDWSESNENDDSLEQADAKDSLFTSTPTTKDSLCENFTNVKVCDRLKSTVLVSCTPNNSIISFGVTDYKMCDSENSESAATVVSPEVISHKHPNKYVKLSPIARGSFDDLHPTIEERREKPQKAQSNVSAWVVDMASSPKSEFSDDTLIPIKNPLSSTSKSSSSVENCKSRSSVDSDCSEKSTHKFYIDLSTLPDTSPDQAHENDENNEKKNIFSMFIGLDDKPTAVKDMPVRLSSSLNLKKKTKCKSSNPKVSVMLDETLSTTALSEFDATFEKLESLCEDPTISIPDIISNSPSSHTVKSNNIIKDKVTQNDPGGLFVKLSDLDKPAPNLDIVSNIAVPAKERSHERMSRSDNNWSDASQMNNWKYNDVISSFHSENALSLNRLFPHLKKDFSRSMSGCLSSATRSSLRLGVSSSQEEQSSDRSEMSSIHSSYCQSVAGNSTTEDSSQISNLINNYQSRLGQDLLRMFLQEIAPDVIVETNGRHIKAHKCILSSRCEYFAGILSGRWVRNAGNIISLWEYSYNVVHFTLRHIYSGVAEIPEDVSVLELTMLTDMLGLEGLKEAIMFNLKAKRCHHFHKPCAGCTEGVLESLSLAYLYGLDELYRKCLRWITKHFHEVWPTEKFATLIWNLREKCYQEHVVNFTSENIFQTVCGCGITMASLQKSAWSEPVSSLCERLVHAAAQYAAPQLEHIVRAMACEPRDVPAPAARSLAQFVAAAVECAPPDEACRTYAYLFFLVDKIRSVDGDPARPDNVLHVHAELWLRKCETVLARAGQRVVGTRVFNNLPVELRKRLCELGRIKFGPPSVLPAYPAQKPSKGNQSSRNLRSHSATARSLDIDLVRASFVPYATRPQPQSIPPADARLPKARSLKVRTTKAQEERAKFNKTKTAQPREPPLLSKTRTAYQNTKPRLMEPRQMKEKRVPLKQSISKLVSSSESSGSHLSGAPGSSRPRTADPSTDSLTDSQNSNRFATYTKAKHTIKGSIESVQTMKSNTRSAPLNAKMTKIPVHQNYRKHNVVSAPKEVQRRPHVARTVTRPVAPSSQACNKATNGERKPSGSLMNATKSSSAKMVPKILKETHNTKCVVKQDKQTGKCKQTAPRSPIQIPIMERSGTFHKDEPQFGEKTTNFDIDK